jgi:quercetin dioxygenase-like cupin family protein
MRRLTALLPAILIASIAGAASGQGSNLKWGPAPPTLPAGAKMAVVSGDPGQPGPFAIQLSMPNGYQIKPHTHPTAEVVSVVKGTFLVGMDKTWDAAAMKPMATGANGSIPANMAHYAQAKGATVIQISSTGPFAINYVNPSDDPSKKTAQLQ